MYAFAYHRPASVAEAAKLLGADKDARLLAGGQTLIPTLKQRLAQPSALIDLGRIEALRKLEVGPRAVTIGALVRHAEVAASKDVARAIPALAKLASTIGDPLVRHMGTIGGSLANNDPAADYPAAVLGLGASLKTNKRTIAADDFFKGLFSTALAPDEILTEVEFPIPEKAGYAKFPNPASRYALVGVMVAKTASGVRVAVTGAGPGVFRVKEMEQALAKSFTPQAIAQITVPSQGLNADLHASADYRAHLITVMAQRALAQAA
jgi:carbon-monoxide dehydrogenase medium subunit